MSEITTKRYAQVDLKQSRETDCIGRSFGHPKMSMHRLFFDPLRIVVEILVLPPRSKGGETIISRCFETSGSENTRISDSHGWPIAGETTAELTDVELPAAKDVALSKALQTISVDIEGFGSYDEIPEIAAVDTAATKKRHREVYNGSQKRTLFPVPVHFKIILLSHDIQDSTTRRSMGFLGCVSTLSVG